MAAKRIAIPVGSGDGFIMFTFRQDEHGDWICKAGSELMGDLKQSYDIPPNSRVEILDAE